MFDNRPDFGDNLLALQALEVERSRKRCELFDAQDAIDVRRDDIIARIVTAPAAYRAQVVNIPLARPVDCGHTSRGKELLHAHG